MDGWTELHCVYQIHSRPPKKFEEGVHALAIQFPLAISDPFVHIPICVVQDGFVLSLGEP